VRLVRPFLAAEGAGEEAFADVPDGGIVGKEAGFVLVGHVVPPLTVVPAKAGAHAEPAWMPAFAGMT
jgi:hypothetical protein